MVICLEWGADLRMAQLMPLPLTVSCFSKIQIGFTFLVLAHLGSPGKGPLNRCVCVCVTTVNCSVLFFSRPRSDGWPPPLTYFLHLSLSFWLTLPWGACLRLDVVHPSRAWSSSPACTWQVRQKVETRSSFPVTLKMKVSNSKTKQEHPETSSKLVADCMLRPTQPSTVLSVWNVISDFGLNSV